MGAELYEEVYTAMASAFSTSSERRCSLHRPAHDQAAPGVQDHGTYNQPAFVRTVRSATQS